MSMRVLIFYFLLLRAAVSEEHCDAIDATGNTNFDEDNELLQVNADHASVAATIDVMEDSIKENSSHDLVPSIQTVSRRREEMDLEQRASVSDYLPSVFATLTIQSGAEYTSCRVRSESSYSTGKFLCYIRDGTRVKVDLKATELVTTKSLKNRLMQQLPTGKIVYNQKLPCWSGGWVTQACFDGCKGLKGTTCYDKFLQTGRRGAVDKGDKRTPAVKAIDHAIDKYGAMGARLRTEDKAAHGQIEAAKQLEASAFGEVLHELDQITRLPEEGRKDEFAAMLKKWCPAETLRGRGVCWMIQGAATGDHKGSAIEQVQREILEIGQLTDAKQKRKRFGALLKEWHCSGKLEDDVCAEITKAAADGR